eukprot:TRINITY_DN591_c10_g1_i1.p1 TRINITY_DN591_c10_g1~~TRINITY_DN591_c10_g1_i1.p1  ORF type:complete len:598 (+),score=95.25 TRINITY_DN591_c10_g1_i1:104-1897(+)
MASPYSFLFKSSNAIATMTTTSLEEAEAGVAPCTTYNEPTQAQPKPTVNMEEMMDQVGGAIKKLVEEGNPNELEWVKVVISEGGEKGVKITTESEKEAIAKGGEVWLNSLLKASWPYISEHVSSVMRKNLGPALGSALRLYSLSLGETWPEVSSTQVSTLQGGTIQIKCYITWDADVELQVDAGPGTGSVGMSAGVNGVRVEGGLTIQLGPACSTAPYFNTLQVFFSNPPTIDMGFTGLGVIAGSLPGVNHAIHNAVDSGLSSICVLPNRLSIPLNGKLSALNVAKLRKPPPVGVLHAKVTSSRCIKTGMGLLWEDTSPVFILKLSGTQFPESGYAMVFSEDQELQVTVQDHRENILDVGKVTVGTMCKDTFFELALDNGGVVVLRTKWRVHEEESPVLVGLQMDKVDMHPAPDSETGPFRVSVAGGPLSGPGGVRWAKGDQRARNDLLLGVLKRLRDLELSNDTAATILSLPTDLVNEYEALGVGELEEWLVKVQDHHVLQASAQSPFYGDTMYFLQPAGTPLSLSIVDNTSAAVAAFSTELQQASTLIGPFNFTPLDSAVGSVACSLTARIVTTKLIDIPLLHAPDEDGDDKDIE